MPTAQELQFIFKAVDNLSAQVKTMRGEIQGMASDTKNAGDAQVNAGKGVDELTGYIRKQRGEQRQQNFLFREGSQAILTLTGNNKLLSTTLGDAFDKFQAVDATLSSFEALTSKSGGKVAQLGSFLGGMIGPIGLAAAAFGGLGYWINSTVDATFNLQKELFKLQVAGNEVPLKEQIVAARLELEKIKNGKWYDDLVVKATYLAVVWARGAGDIGKFLEGLYKANKEEEKGVKTQEQKNKIKALELDEIKEIRSIANFETSRLEILNQIYSVGKNKLVADIEQLNIEKKKYDAITIQISQLKLHKGTEKEVRDLELERLNILLKQKQLIQEMALTKIKPTLSKEEIEARKQALTPAGAKFGLGGVIPVEPIREVTNTAKVMNIEIASGRQLWEELAETIESKGTMAEQTVKIMENAVGEFSGGLAAALVEGQNFGEILKNLFTQLLEQIIQMVIEVTILKSALSFITGGLFSIFHSGGEVAHSGLQIGQHSFASDERLIIAQTGERVLSREQNLAYESSFMQRPSFNGSAYAAPMYNSMGASSGGGGSQNFYITTLDTVSLRNYLERPENRKTIVQASQRAVIYGKT